MKVAHTFALAFGTLVGLAGIGAGCNIVAGLQPAQLIACTSPTECPAGGECSTAQCIGGACGLASIANGTACNGNLGSCQAGSCACLPANTCPDGCFNLMGDPAHCGTCSNACSMGDFCIDGQCACPGGLTMCAGMCVDTTTDPANCGTCGHSCQGGACLGSTCQPVILASGLVQPTSLAVDATSVYWTNLGMGPTSMDGTVMACAIGGCGGAPTTLSSGLTFPSGIAIDAINVYWTSNAGVMKCAKSGCMGPTTLSSDVNAMGIGPIAVDTMNLYWTNAVTSTVMKCALSNCSGTLAILATGQNTPVGIAVDALGVYWANDAANSTVFKVALTGGTPTTIAFGQDSPIGVALNTTNVYWTTSDSIMACSLSGCGGTPTVIASGLTGPFHTVADATNVYWTDPTGSVNKHPITGGTTTTLAALPNSGPYDIAQDATCLYWTDIGTSTVMKLAK